MDCPSCAHVNPHDSTFCENCGMRLALLCAACGAENRSGSRFCRECGTLLDLKPSAESGVDRTMAFRPARAAAANSTGSLPIIGAVPVDQEPRDRAQPQIDRTSALAAPPWNGSPGAARDISSSSPENQSSFAGREHEIERLLQLVDLACSGRSQLVSITGPDGIGKTRLAIELSRRASERSLWWLNLAVAEPSPESAWQTVGDLLGRIFSLGREAGTITGLAAQLARLLPADSCPPFAAAIGSFFGVPDSGVALEPEVRRRLIVRAAQQGIRALAAQRPLVLVIDDLHLADASSIAFLDGLIQSIEALPVLIVSTHDSAFRPPWAMRANAATIPLSGLPLEECAPLFDRILDAQIDADTASFLVEQTEGNPLFLEALVRMFDREQYLERMDGVLVLPPRRQVLVPSSLDEIYRLQIEQLGESVRLALGPAVALGNSFSLGELGEVVRAERTWAVPDSLLVGSLKRLVDHALIDSSASAGVYRFRHPIVRSVAADFVPIVRAQRLHTLIARLLEQRTGRPAGAAIEQIAFHYDRGDRPLKAIEYHTHAAERASSVRAYPEALAHLKRAIARLDEVTAEPERATLVPTLYTGIAEIEAQMGALESADIHIHAALDATTDPSAQAAALAGLSKLYARQWRHQDAINELVHGEERLLPQTERGDEAVRIAIARLKHLRATLLRDLNWFADAETACAEALEVLDAQDGQFDDRLSSAVQIVVASICSELGEIRTGCRQFEGAEAALGRALVLAQRSGDRKQEAQITNQLAHLAWLQGDLDAAAERYRRARDIEVEVGDLRASSLSTHNLALVFWRQWKLSEAEAFLLEALAGLELVGELAAIPTALANLERIYWYRGDFDRLTVLHEKELGLAQEAGWDRRHADQVFRGQLALEQGDPTAAETFFRSAIAMPHDDMEEKPSETGWLLGQALVMLGRLDEARATLRQSLSLAEERRQFGSQALLHLSLAELEFVRGDRVAAAREASRAAEIADLPDQRLRLATRHLLGRYHRLLGRLAVLNSDWPRATAEFEQSLEILGSIEAFLEAARTCLIWARAVLDAAHAPANEIEEAQEGRAEIDPSKTRELLTDALRVFEASHLSHEQQEVQKLLARL